ncbi:MAG: glycosyltransferase family 39 protein [Parvularculaceae bacterium]
MTGGKYLQGMLNAVSSVRGVAVFFILYGVVNAVITRAAGPALALDDVKLNVLTQSWRGGYLPENPPLFEWMLIAVQGLAGPALASFLIVKYAFLTLTGVFTFLAARAIMDDARWAGLTALSLLLIYQIGSNYHQAFTHSTALIMAAALFWFALVNVIRTRTIPAYALLGLAVGLGVLAKYSFLASAGLGLVACLTTLQGRRALAAPGAVLSLAIAAAICAPHVFWLMADNTAVAQEAGARLAGSGAPHWRRALAGLPAAVWAVIAFFLPLALVLAAAFPGLVSQLRADPETEDCGAALVQRATLLGAGALIAAVVIFGIDNMQERYAIAFMYPGLFWLMLAARRAASERAITRYAAIVVAVVAAMASLRVIEAVVAGPPFCDQCRQWVPYENLGRTVSQLDIDGATLVGFEDHTAGNLRRLFPSTRVLSAHMPFYTPQGWADGDKCYFIWSDQLGPPAPEHVTGAVDPDHVWTVDAPWRGPFRKDGWRVTRWTIAEFSHRPGIARSLCRPDVLR